MPEVKEIPDTIRHPLERAQEMGTIRRPLAMAQELLSRAQDEGQRAYRTAYAALKQMVVTAGDRWEREHGRRPRGARPADRRRASRPAKRTAGATRRSGASKSDLMEEAKRLEVSGRSRMSKDELARAVQRAKRQG